MLYLYYIYLIVRSFFASGTPYLRIFTPILTHLIDFLTHQVRIFFTSRCQIHAPSFPSKTSFQHHLYLKQKEQIRKTCVPSLDRRCEILYICSFYVIIILKVSVYCISAFLIYSAMRKS